MRPRQTGTIVSWFDEKGYGFIQSDDDDEKCFVHITDFVTTGTRPSIGQKVSYIPATDSKDRLCALIVRQLNVFNKELETSESPELPDMNKFRKRIPTLIRALLFSGGHLAIILFLTKVGKLPDLIFTIYLTFSAFSLIAYASDKRKAIRNYWRTPEATLHLIDLTGGWPGGLIAQHLFNHKRNKPEFTSFYWLTVFINCGVLAWLFMSDKKEDVWRFSDEISTLTNNLLNYTATYIKSFLH